uniref:Uncharacterized protein n=1 Tax=Cucumis melo TaxID=3656 RepID=A0A9I9ELX4_CUCME
MKAERAFFRAFKKVKSCTPSTLLLTAKKFICTRVVYWGTRLYPGVVDRIHDSRLSDAFPPSLFYRSFLFRFSTVAFSFDTFPPSISLPSLFHRLHALRF